MMKIVKGDEWLELRKTVVTATEASTVIGLNPWSSAQKMYSEKLESTFVPNSYVFMGQLLEPIVCEMTNYLLGTEFKILESEEGKPFYILDTHRLGATPDASDGATLLECKTTKPYNLDRWSDKPPLYYITQLHVQMMCCDIDKGILGIMGTDLSQESEELVLPYIAFSVTRNREFEDILLTELDRFWYTVEKGEAFRVDSKAKKKALELIETTFEKII